MAVTTISADRTSNFIDFAWTLHADDPRWIPPIRQSLTAELSGADCFGRYASMERFAYVEEDRIRGRLAAIINPRVTDDDGHPVGQIGYFECEDEPDVARALFDAASDWLGKRGARTTWGPINGGAHRSHRLLVRGFDSEPFLFEPRNPAYYPALFESCGFTRKHSWQTYELTAEVIPPLQRRMRLVASRIPSHQDPLLLDPRDTAAVLQRLHPMLDDAWKGHIGYAHLDLDELIETYSGLMSIMENGQLGVVQDKRTGSDVGCAFMYPDYAADVRALDGDGTRWASWLGGSRPAHAVLHTVAMTDAGRMRGGAAHLIKWGLDRLEADGYPSFYVALVTEEMTFFRRVADATREYALYERPL